MVTFTYNNKNGKLRKKKNENEKKNRKDLLLNTKWIYVTIGDIPSEKSIRVLGSSQSQQQH